ncbi:hypothetical protein [Nostoc sp. JL33]|uniref:hypothetical protein n=1 Tax=Nostoc sp. JL33 TaxID=2815396 RepID=UPI0025F5C171|nr:hypothetical protein [Nostoc sp. JL33]MBN3873981.1 hypothetical protein [Nostoc sp. JL33]
MLQVGKAAQRSGSPTLPDVLGRGDSRIFARGLLFSIESIIWINEREHHTTYYTNKEILEALLYGEIAHFTQMEDYQKLYGNHFNKSFNLMEFMVIIENFKRFILIVKEINQQAIPYMKS